MPSFPVGRGGIMLNGAAAPAAAIINNGPGLLYLYRNSAVSSYAYDTVIGPSGSFQWPGGELWAASDSTTTVNVLAGLSAFDSGTTTVAGTVTAVTSSGATSPVRIRSVSTGGQARNSGSTSSYSVLLPSVVQVGDLLLAYLTGDSGNTSFVPYNNDNPANQSWDLILTNGITRIYSRLAVAADTSPRNSTWGIGNNLGSNVTIIAFSGATAYTNRAQFGTGISDVRTLFTGNVAPPSYFILFTYGSPVATWGTAANGGPPSSPPWIANGAFQISISNWSVTGSFSLTVDQNNGGYINLGTVA